PHGIRLLEEGRQLASSEAARVRIARHAQVRRWNAAYESFTTAVGARDFAAASTALVVLEAAQEAHDAPEIQDALEQCRQALHSLRVFQDSKPIQSAPLLWTLNGCGTRIYGRAAADHETGTYVGTLFFTLLFVPILALSRFRMCDGEGGGY